MDKSRKQYISFLNVIASISVVFLHTNRCFWNYSNSRYWFTANIIESIFYYAVPFFFMISGITLINYRDKYSTKEYFKKRLNKVVIPFIIWSIISLIYSLFYTKGIRIADLNFKRIVNGIMGTQFLTIYWFFIALFILYLTIPILSSIEKKSRKKVFLYIVVLGFILNSLLPFINSIFKLGYILPIRLVIGTDYILYALIGYLIDNGNYKNRYKIIIYVLGLAGLFVHIFMTYNLSLDSGRIIELYKGYNNVPCILYSTALFIFLKNAYEKYLSNRMIVNKVINNMCKYTFSIYLMHWYIMEIIQDIFKLNHYSIVYRLGMPFIIIPICIGITWLLRKIPVVKRIVP